MSPNSQGGDAGTNPVGAAETFSSSRLSVAFFRDGLADELLNIGLNSTALSDVALDRGEIEEVATERYNAGSAFGSPVASCGYWYVGVNIMCASLAPLGPIRRIWVLAALTIVTAWGDQKEKSGRALAQVQLGEIVDE
jgi:hypothetical protein